MKKWSVLAASFIGFYFAFLIALLPMSTVTNNVTFPKGILLSGVSGSIWQGYIDNIYIDDVLIEQVNVGIKPFSLLLFNPVVTIEFGDPIATPIEGHAEISGLLSDMEVSDAQIHFPANMVAQQINLPIDVFAHQQVSLTVEHFQMGKPICEYLQGKIHWKKASVTSFEQKILLGDLSGDLGCEKGFATLTISPKNNLGLTFNAKVGANFRASGEGHILPSDNTPEAIKQVLPFIGKPDNKGRYPLRF